MIFLPVLARLATLRGDRIVRVMEPAVPVRRHARGFGFAVVHDPALAPAACDNALVLEVAIAFGVGTDEFAAHLGEEPRAENHEPTTRSKCIGPLVRVRPVTGNATGSSQHFTSFVVMRFALENTVLPLCII